VAGKRPQETLGPGGCAILPGAGVGSGVVAGEGGGPSRRSRSPNDSSLHWPITVSHYSVSALCGNGLWVARGRMLSMLLGRALCG